MTAYKRQLTVGRPARIELQVMVDLGRLPVFVNTKNADIKVKARVLEVVRIAAVKCNLLLWYEDKADVIVALETIKMVDAALVECDDIGTQTSFVFAFFFNCCDGRFARIGSLLARHLRFDRTVDARG